MERVLELGLFERGTVLGVKGVGGVWVLGGVNFLSLSVRG